MSVSASEAPSTINIDNEADGATESARGSIVPEIVIDTYDDLEAEADDLLEEEEDEEEDEDEDEEEEEGIEREIQIIDEEDEGYDDDDFKDDYFLEYTEQFGPEETFRNLDSSNVQDLINMLAKVKLIWPEDLPHYDEHQYNSDAERSKFPASFSHCSSKEKAVMWHAENFRRQFTHIFPDRRPLLIAPKNECGTQKLFSTFINPTTLGYPEFYEPETTGKFLKDFLSPQFFRPPTRVPRIIRSHFTVLKDRKANSFEASVIIASLLNGAGFDSYVVDGYATKEITTMCEREEFLDLEDEDAPLKVVEADFEFNGEELPDEEIQEQKEEDDDDDFDVFGRRESDIRPVSPSKYRVRAPKVYFSQYEKAMEKRAEEKAEEERLAAEKEAYEEMMRNQRPPTPDPLFGFRTHAWVMIMKGKRSVENSFFLEPFSGLRKEISDQNFLGIEAVFNEKNYYANIQDCSAGISDISYNLDDKSKWAKLLLEPPCRRSCKKTEDEEDDEEEGAPTASLFNEEEDEEAPPCEKYLDMPVSWTPELNIPQEDYEKKYPEGSKIKDYTDAFVETAAPWVNSDGLIKKIIKFDGATRDPKRLLYIEERFAHRQDKLERRKWLKDGRTLHEFFEKGRKDSLKEHIHQSGKNKAHNPRHLYYYSDAHPQNVSHREVIPNGLVEEFEGRDDLLYYRAIYYGGFLCHTIPQDEDPKIAKVRAMLDVMRGEEHGNKNKPRKKILRIDEKYHRNPTIDDADQDIAEKYLFMAEGKIVIYFHYGNDNFTRKSMEFFKPRGVKVDEVDFRPEDCVEFRVDPFSVPTSNYDKFLILKTLSKDELRAGSQARQAEDEIYHTVTQRIQEDWTHKMEPSPYTQIEQLQQRKEGERDDEEDFTGVDFASPYLEKFGKPATKRQEIALKQKIIKDARERIIKRAKCIQKEYDEESAKLKTKMEWYDRMKDSMSSEEDEEFHLFYNQALFKMHIMEQRLVRHREQAPSYFNNLLTDVLRHPVLNYFANRKISREEKQRRVAEQEAQEEERKRAEALARIPKDICCDYKFKYQEAKKSRVNIGGETTLGGDVGVGGDADRKAGVGKAGVTSSQSKTGKGLPGQVGSKLGAAMGRMSKIGAIKPPTLSRTTSKGRVASKKKMN